MVEHRKHRRYPVRFKSIFSTDGVHIEDGVVTDLSLEGCRLTSAIHVPPDIPIEIHIRPDQHAPVYVSRAVVRWERNSVFGLEFKDLPHSNRQRLLACCGRCPLESRMAHGILAARLDAVPQHWPLSAQTVRLSS